MERVLEPELMIDEAQARAYAEADFAEPHQAAVERFRAKFPEFTRGRVLDLGCGPGDVTVRFARAFPDITVLGIDGSAAMLECARERLVREALVDRVAVEQRRLPDPGLVSRGPFDAVISTAVLHHLPDPSVLWETVFAMAAPGAPVFVQDLMRPPTDTDALRLTALHTVGGPTQLRDDYLASLRAAFTVAELRAQVGDRLTVEAVSDRHLVVSGRAG